MKSSRIDTSRIKKIIKLLENQEIVIKDIKSEDPDLEDVFVNLTNN